jgi:hypothetical protein
VIALLADEHCETHLAALVQTCRSPRWREIWDGIGAAIHTFESAHISRAIPDGELWTWCQRNGHVLITANRNEDSPTSLETTIRTRGTAASLPVLTLANSDRILKDSAYGERAAVRLMEILLDLDSLRGTGRLFLPREP